MQNRVELWANLCPNLSKGQHLWECLLWPGGDLDDSGPQCDHWPCPGDNFSLLKLSKTPSEAREKQVFESSAKNCQTPTLNGRSLAPIGPFSTSPATKTLTSTS